MSSRLPHLLPLALLLSCASDPSEEQGTQLGERYTAVLLIRQAADGTMSASADVLDANECTVMVEGPVLVNGHEMEGGYTAGVDACVQSRYMYQLDGLERSADFELTVDGHVLAVVEQD